MIAVINFDPECLLSLHSVSVQSKDGTLDGMLCVDVGVAIHFTLVW